MSEGDNSRRSDISERNATRAGILAAFVLAASAAGGALIADSVRRPVQGAGPFPSETGLMPTEQPSPTPRFEWDHMGPEGARRETANSSDIPRLEGILKTTIQDSAMPPDLLSRLDSLKTAAAEKISLNLHLFSESEDTFYYENDLIERHRVYDYYLLPFEGEPGIYYAGQSIVWAKDTIDSHGKHRLFASFRINENGQMVSMYGHNESIKPARFIELAHEVLKAPFGEFEQDGKRMFSESEDGANLYWVDMYPSDGRIDVYAQDKEFSRPSLAYGPNHPAPTSSPSV